MVENANVTEKVEPIPDIFEVAFALKACFPEFENDESKHKHVDNIGHPNDVHEENNVKEHQKEQQDVRNVDNENQLVIVLPQGLNYHTCLGVHQVISWRVVNTFKIFYQVPRTNHWIYLNFECLEVYHSLVFRFGFELDRLFYYFWCDDPFITEEEVLFDYSHHWRNLLSFSVEFTR